MLRKILDQTLNLWRLAHFRPAEVNPFNFCSITICTVVALETMKWRREPLESSLTSVVNFLFVPEFIRKVHRPITSNFACIHCRTCSKNQLKTRWNSTGSRNDCASACCDLHLWPFDLSLCLRPRYMHDPILMKIITKTLYSPGFSSHCRLWPWPLTFDLKI